MPPKIGRPAKKKRNIFGLRNQPAPSTILLESANQNAGDNQPDSDTDDDDGEDQLPKDLKDMASSEKEEELDSDFESNREWKGLTSQDLGKRLAALSCAIDGDSKDTDWIPYKLRVQQKKGNLLFNQYC